MDDVISGGCLCGGVKYSIKNSFEFLLFCHCDQCRRITGSAHASNLFSTTDSLTWDQGQSFVEVFRHPKGDFTKAFCRQCGSGLPYTTQSGHAVIVPAGSLNGDPNVGKKAEVFLSERTAWTPSVTKTDTFEHFPDYFDD